MASFAPKFGSYEYASEAGIYVEKVTRPTAVKTRQADTPGLHGGYSAGGLLAPRQFNISGLIVGTSDEDTRDKVEAFAGAHPPGPIRTFYFYSDRYINAEVSAISNTEFGALANISIPFDVEFTAVDPFFYDVDTNTQLDLDEGGTVTAGGTAPAAPLWTLVIGSLGTDGTLTLTNTTTGEALVLAPTTTGTYLIDSRLQTITRSGSDVSEQMNGLYPTLAMGDNDITVETTGGLAVSSLAVSWQNRYY